MGASFAGMGTIGPEGTRRAASMRCAGTLFISATEAPDRIERSRVAVMSPVRDEPVLVLDDEPRLLGLHQRERALQLLPAQLEGELSRREPFAHLALGLGAVVEEGALLVRRVDAASQTITSPAPYCFGGITPSNEA
jgi:hypothetical protein